MFAWQAFADESSPHHEGPLKRQIDFDTEIVPILTRSGCNVGSCHGAAAGRGGFHLSLLGGDPEADYASIVEQFEGRRVHVAQPERSLILRKPTLQLEHEGGQALSSEGAERLKAWIASGARRIRQRSLQTLDVQPKLVRVEQPGDRVVIRITAHFDDGTHEDVSKWTVLVANDPSAIDIDTSGPSVQVLRRGEHTLIARYLDRVVPIRIRLPLSDTIVDHRTQPIHNFIDEHIFRTLTELRLTVSPTADDATFLRRVSLDLTGRLPTPAEVLIFLEDPMDSKSKRQQCVDRLLESDAFVDYWTYRFAKLLRLYPQPNDKKSVQVYHTWIGQQIRNRTSMDRMARELLTAIGDTHQMGPANFTRSSADARAQAELISQVFMGTRLQCANCHNHPLDRWTQDDYHGLAAIFARLDRGRVVQVVERGTVTNVRTGAQAVPRIPGERYLPTEEDSRAVFAEWLTGAGNPYFARSFVNRLWRGLFGRGLVDPADDLRDTNPATHPELLEELAQDFATHGYDLRHALRRIVTSATYARSSLTDEINREDDRFYSHAYKRPLEPEVMADAISDATGVAERYGDEPLGRRAVQLVDTLTPSETLDALGRCLRRESCEGVSVSSALPTKLHQLNGNWINSKIASQENHLHQRLATTSRDVDVIDTIYLQTLSRPPSDQEQQHWLQKTGTTRGKIESNFLKTFFGVS